MRANQLRNLNRATPIDTNETPNLALAEGNKGVHMPEEVRADRPRRPREPSFTGHTPNGRAIQYFHRPINHILADRSMCRKLSPDHGKESSVLGSMINH